MKKISDKFRLPRPCTRAEGRVCIELTDPCSGRVTQRIIGKNHVFTDTLFSNNWIADIGAAYTVLTDDNTAVDAAFPYLLGNTIGYGIPSNSGSGTYRGAYNSANQVIANMTLNSCRWKFQYDFTTAQAIGTIRTIGLTNQFRNSNSIPVKSFKCNYITIESAGLTDDGRYAYSCASNGVITKYDLLYNTKSTIDVSATVGTSNTKVIGYASDTKKYYVFVISSTTSSCVAYEFSDNSFTTVTSTFSTSNIALNYGTPTYIYGNFVFQPSSNTVYYADFMENVAGTTVTVKTMDIINPYYSSQLNACTASYKQYMACGNTYTGGECIHIFDMSNKAFIGQFKLSSSSNQCIVLHPLLDSALFCIPISTGTGYTLFYNAALTKYVLPTPVVKDSSHGMTVTYELEVFWK